MLIKEKKFHHRSPPTHSVWSGALIKQQKKRRNIFTFQICCIFKSSTVCGPCRVQGLADKRIAQGEMTQVTNGW